ncbi:protein of unknown function [Bradyrhizobium vignae]|uniref:Uncharacterized protein n=1 Tax=Bradyrhizobium vignae TaxID=1549949 RepID=A0A2U3PUJ1_9BRAD|nr:protein of unknown function [Bradyrhizobium vignae]
MAGQSNNLGTPLGCGEAPSREFFKDLNERDAGISHEGR